MSKAIAISEIPKLMRPGRLSDPKWERWANLIKPGMALEVTDELNGQSAKNFSMFVQSRRSGARHFDLVCIKRGERVFLVCGR